MTSHSRLRAIFLASAVSIFAVGTAHAEVVAPQAPTSAASASEPGEILVTARRVKENVQRVPVSVTVLSPDTMRNTIVTDFASLMSQIPGYEGLGGSHSAGSLSLSRVRGITPVATYFADAPYPARQFTFNAPFFDVGSVQFLKGPQGTLFGQASNAGAELIAPKRPGKVFGGYVQADAGEGHYRSIEGALDIPLADNLQVRLSAITRHRDSYVKDALTGRSMVDTDYNVERLSVVYNPTPDIENYTVFQTEYYGNGTTVTNQVLGDFNFADNSNNRLQAVLNGFTNPDGTANLTAWNDARAQILAQQIALGPWTRQGWSVACPGSSLTTTNLSKVPGPGVNSVVPEPCGPGGGFVRIYSLANTTTFTLSDALTLKNTFSHVWGRTRAGMRDIDGTRLIINENNAKEMLGVDNLPATWSEELQLNGKFGALDFVLGAFTYEERLNQTWPTFTGYTLSMAQTATLTNNLARSRSLYGQANYDLSSVVEGLKVTAGLRQTWDHSEQKIQNLRGTDLSLISVVGGPGSPVGSGDWHALSYTLSAQYQASPSTMFYLTNAKGYSGGGLQNIAGHEKFNPDSLNNFELGIKTTLRPAPGVSIRANAAAYYGFYNDVKVRQAIPILVVGGNGALTTTLITANAGKARIRGFEAEVNGTFGDLFDLNANVAYADPYYTSFPSVNSAGQPIDLSNTPFYTTPKWKFAISPTLHLPVDRTRVGDISLGALITYRGMMYSNTVKPITPTDPNNPDTGAVCRVRRTVANGYPSIVADGQWAYKNCMPATFKINANITWVNPLGHEGLRASFVVNNVTKSKTPTGGDTQYDNLNTVGTEAIEPRRFYVTLNYQF